MVVVWFWKLLICAMNYTFVAYDQDSFLLMEHIESEITWGHKDVRFILILIFTHKSHTFYRVECLIGIAQWPSASCLTLNRSKSWFITILLTMILQGQGQQTCLSHYILSMIIHLNGHQMIKQKLQNHTSMNIIFFKLGLLQNFYSFLETAAWG